MRLLGRFEMLLACSVGLAGPAYGADHLDSVDLLDTPAADINDLYAFVPYGTDNLVLALSVNRFANSAAPMGGNTEFDPDTLYQFKIDNGGASASDPLDGVAEHTVDIQFNQAGTTISAAQYIRITGLPSLNGGAETVLELDADGMATEGGVKVFAGLRDDPFFFDLKWFFDVAATHPLADVLNDGEDFYHYVFPGAPEVINLSEADTFATANVSMIVLEFPKADVLGTNDVIGVWAATRQ